jgi:hypothetical protein
MQAIKEQVNHYLKGEQSNLSTAMFNTYRPAIDSYYSELNLNYTSPEEDHPILGGRPMEGDLQGIIIAIEKTEWGGSIERHSLESIQKHVMDFLSSAQDGKAFTLGSVGLNDLHRQFALKASQGIQLVQQTTLLIITRGVMVENFQGKEGHVPVEVIDAMQAEAALHVSTPISSVDGVFVFEPTKHERPKVFRDPSPHNTHSIHMGHITGLALSDMFRAFGRKMIEVNVRDFLGDTSINKGMRETIKIEPERFAAYNNGLTIVCSSVEIEGNEIISIENPSVVNGGQTTMVIVDEARKGTAVQSIRVPIRVVEITSTNAADVKQLPSLISRYANTQNNIKTTDQLVNEEPHPSLNEYCVEHADDLGGWYYAHRRGMVKTLALEMGQRFPEWEEKHPAPQRVEAIDASTLWAAWIGQPEAAALGPQRCFTFYHGYVTTEHARGRLKEDHFLKQTFALQLLKFTVQTIANATKQTTMFSSTFPHTLGWFSHLTEHKFDLVHVFEEGNVPGDVRVVLRVLFDQVNSYLRKIEDELPSEHAKKRECTEAIQSINLDESILKRIQNLPRMLGRPLKGEPLGRYLVRIGANKLWDAFNFVKEEHSDGNMGGMGKDFFNGMRYGLAQKGENMDASEVLKIMRVWNLANHLGYSDQYPGEHDIYMSRE